MKKMIAALMLIVPCAMVGCGTTGGTAAVGAVGGAAAGGGVYEYRLHQAMQRIEADHNAGKWMTRNIRPAKMRFRDCS